jgi:hypothetical protein
MKWRKVQRIKFWQVSYRLLNTSGTRLGLRHNSGCGKQESEDNAYVLVKYWLEAVIRAKRCSNVSPINSDSSLTSTLYFIIITVTTAMLSVSKNLEKKNSIHILLKSITAKFARTVSRGTHGHLQRIHEARSSVIAEPNPPELNGKKASLGQSSRNLSGRKV